MRNAIGNSLGTRKALALVVAMIVTSPPALAQNVTITMEKVYSPEERITFGYSNAPYEQGLILIVPKGTPINETDKNDLRSKYYGRLHYAPKRLGVLETKRDESWGPLKVAGEYELRIYDGNDNLVGQQPFRIGNPTTLETTIEAAAIEQPPDEQPSAPSTTGNEATGGPAIKTNKSVYAAKEGIAVTFSNAPGNAKEIVVLVPKGQAVDNSKGLKGLWLGGRKDGENTLVGLDAGEYEARLYGAGNELLASHPFRVE